MPGLFSGDVSVVDGDVVLVDVDPRHAYLADHRVGGRPLLSTVLSLEVLASALVAWHPKLTVATIERVVVGSPLFVDGPLQATVRTRDAGPGRFSVHLASEAGVHLSANLITGPTALRLRAPAPGCHGRETVNAADIYALYFHGPAFQVLERVWWSGDVMIGELSTGRPELRDGPPPMVTAPLLTELCLQTAGLWELAARGAMNIPSSIDRITRRGGRDADDGGGRLRAVVRPTQLTSGGPSVDADVVDEEGRVQLEVRGYRTSPIPAPFDKAAAARIRQQLSSVPVG